jgi:hypothetical protein
VCIAFASFDSASGAASTFNARHTLSPAGLVPFNAGRTLATQQVRDRGEDVERAEEAKHPGRTKGNWFLASVVAVADRLKRHHPS